MALLRRRLRLLVVVWMVFQAAALSALVPRACCLANYDSSTVNAPACHEKAAAPHCPMPASDGMPCPMHRGQANTSQKSTEHDPSTDNDRKSDGRCAMRGTCGGPAAALLTLLSGDGVLPDSLALLPNIGSHVAPASAREHLIRRLASPDTPPPRS